MATKKTASTEIFFSSIHEWRNQSLPKEMSTALEDHELESEDDISAILSSRIDARLKAGKILQKVKTQ
ncbi:hypothetical protein BCF11_3406 [Collimonas sp. PA-H2]|uniref:hypothetical protein n=1 Tax=Collimonas sp. PA-H2 TaxID=1881062 RepID=UPI000C001B8D|nr:hypothetical protein [Collimonas sp. PA-H2]PFH10968.1 hypothetical protein BCF11_3406 [Collimonas sp. PA-H2]